MVYRKNKIQEIFLLFPLPSPHIQLRFRGRQESVMIVIIMVKLWVVDKNNLGVDSEVTGARLS